MFLLYGCVFSKWVEAIACHKAGALTVAKKALESVFFDWDTTSTISSDQGTTSLGKSYQPLMKTWQTSGNYHRPVTLNHQARWRERMEKLTASRTSRVTRNH